ncbi:DUF6950 family protein [Falsiroseomonas sp.]|uniref:DUF6950 family protein n=1 Tax=Falsiroseomonas sp. TaxID=2870721 RepID=UPI003F726F64
MTDRVDLPRLQDWPERLAELVEDRRHAPFRWGGHDCVLWAADAVLACTGQDPAAEWRGRYATEAEADAIIGTAGGLAELVARAQAQRGAGECAVAHAQRGDTALVEYGNTLMMGVVLGDLVAVPGLNGLVFLKLRAARRAWVT